MIVAFVILGLAVLGVFLWWMFSPDEVVVTETIHVHHQAPRATTSVRTGPAQSYVPPRHTTQTVVTERVVYNDSYVDPVLAEIVAAEIVEDLIDPVVYIDDAVIVDDSYVDGYVQDTSYDDSVDYGNNDSDGDWN
jgi:hypothetical protein